MARKFLYVVVGLIVLALAAAIAYRFWGNEFIRYTLVPGEAYRDQPAVAANAYDDPSMWLSRPGAHNDPARWVPAGNAPGEVGAGAAVFFIHPTSYIGRDHWNARLDDGETNERARVFLRGQASAFNAVGDVWAPRYRQATFGAFLTSQRDAERALALAYRDVDAAFAAFLRAIDPARPIILAGHSQGALHLTHLLRDRVAKDATLKRRIVAAYVVGWPVSRTTDLAAIGLPECTAPTDTGCLLSWQTFAEPADPSLIVENYDRSIGFDGQSRRDTPMVCSNPLTGAMGTAAPATANLGTLYPAADLSTADIQPGKVPARCDPRGFLLIGEPPQVGPYVLPGNNYHVYDYSLFWGNVRADAGRRYAAFTARGR